MVSEDYKFCLLKKLKAVEPSKITKQKEAEQIDRLVNAVDATKPFSQPTGFSVWISWHITLLVFGLLLYILAQVSSTF